MTTRTVQVCDGCGLSTLHSITIQKSQPRYRFIDSAETETIDICTECAEIGRYICDLCHGVHGDANLCGAIRRREAEIAQAAADYYGGQE